jgi:hypothetical protein
MSFLECIGRAMDAGSTDRARGEATQEAWREAADRYSRFTDRRTAEEMAYQDIRDAFTRDTAIRRHARLKDLEVMRRNVKEVRASTDLVGVVRRPIERKEGAVDQPDSIWFMTKALEKQFAGAMGQFFSQINRNIVGNVQEKARLRNVARELHSESTGDATAAAMSQAIHQTFERMRLLFNEAGGHISKLDDWGLPHTHDRQKLIDAGQENWIDQVIDRLDWDRIENYGTGRPFGSSSPVSVRRSFLAEVWDGIAYSNVPKVEPRYAPTPGTGRIGDQHAYQRQLHFLDADAWIEYNEAFGAADLFGSITQHMQRMARDISLMRTFGTNPRMGLEHRFQVALQEAKARRDLNAVQQIQDSIGQTRAMMDQVMGTSSVPENARWANFFSGIRQWTTSSYLGSAILVSGGDLVALRGAAKAVGMNPANALSRHVELMASSATRETAARLGYIADTLTDAGNTAARFTGEVASNEILERLTSFTMRAQGLSYWTDMARTAFRMEFTGLFAENAGRALNDVTPELRDLLTSRGVTPEMWAEFSRPNLMFTAPNGATFISPSYWLRQTSLPARQAEDIAIRMGSIIEEQLEFAVPTMSVSARAAVQRAARPGTIIGELALSALQFKSFGMSVFVNQYARMMARPSPMSRATYFVEMMAGFTLMGAVGVQLKEMAKGNDPRPMDSAAFWGSAALQGGGFGIVGDLFASAESRTGGGFGEFAAGPVLGLAGQVGNATIGNMLQGVRGENMNLGRDLTNLARRNIPVVSSYWPTRTATDRMVFDQIQLFLDPEATQSFNTRAQNRERSYGNRPFWDQGDMLPGSGPSLSSALGN